MVCLSSSKNGAYKIHKRIGPAQDVTFFYTGYHLSDLKSSALISSPSHLNSARHNLVIELCRALLKKRLFSKLMHSFVAIYLLNFSKNAKFQTFLYTKIQILLKKKDNFRYVMKYKNPDTLHYAIFHEKFETDIYIQKA